MGTSMAHPQSLQSLQQAAGGYQVRPYPTAPANLPDGLQGYYGPPAAPAAPYGPAPLAASAVKPVGPTEPFNPSQPTPNMFQQTDNISSQLRGILDYSRPPNMPGADGPEPLGLTTGRADYDPVTGGFNPLLRDLSVSPFLDEEDNIPVWMKDPSFDPEKYLYDSKKERYDSGKMTSDEADEFLREGPYEPGKISPSEMRRRQAHWPVSDIAISPRPWPGADATSAVASNFRTPEQIQEQVNQAMYGKFNPFVQPTPNLGRDVYTVQQTQLPPAGLFTANPGYTAAEGVDTTDLGQNFQTSVGQIQADEAANEAALAQAPLDYESAKAKWEEEAYSGYIGKGEDQVNQRWNTKKQGELPPTKPGWFWQQADEDKEIEFALRPINEEDNSYWYDKRSGKPFQEYDEWFKQNVVMPTPTYTPPDNQKMATDIFSRLY